MNLSILKQILLLRRKSLLALAIFFCVTLVLQLFIMLSQEPGLEKLRLDWLKQRELEGRGAASHDRETIYRNGLADLLKFRERMYVKSHFARFIAELYDLAAKNSLELASITFKPTLDIDDQRLDYQLSITVSGKYLQLKKFVNELGSATNLLVIDSISLASSDASADTVQLHIQITSYFRMEGQ